MVKNKNKHFKKNYLYIIIWTLAFIILFGTGAYAYYQSTIAGSITGSVAKWNFKANNEVSTINIDLGDLYPGISGIYNIELSAEDSDLDVYYEIGINSSDTEIVSFYQSNYSIYKGRYGIIPAGATISIPLYYSWDYNSKINSIPSYNIPIIIIAKQYTGYTGTIPMKLLATNFSYYLFGGTEALDASSGYLKIDELPIG